MDRTRVSLSNDEAKQIYELYKRDPIVFMCRQLLVSAMLSNGLEVTKSGGGEMTHDFKRILDRFWVPFARDLVDHFFMFGFAPWLKVTKPVPKSLSRGSGYKRKARMIEVPIIPPFGSYTVDSYMDKNYVQGLRFVPTRGLSCGHQERTDDRVTILVASDGMPGVRDGHHRSLVATLLPKYRIMQKLFRSTITADHIRSNPPLVTQDAVDKSGFGDTMHEEPFGDPAETLNEAEEKRYRKSKADMKAFQDQQRIATRLNRGVTPAMSDPFSPDSGEMTLKQAYENNLFHLPDGVQVATQPTMPSLRNDLMDIERERSNVVCGCFGVPMSIVLSGRTGHNVGANEVEFRQLMRTIDSVSSNLLRALNEVYEELYPNEDAEFSLPMMPLTSIENILMIRREGLISHRTEGEYLLRAAGLPVSDLCLGELDEGGHYRKGNAIENLADHDDSITQDATSHHTTS